MFSVTDAIAGCTGITPGAAPEHNCNTSSTYIDHDVENFIPTSSHQEASERNRRQQLTMIYIDHCLDGPGSSKMSADIGSHHVAEHEINMRGGLFCLPWELRVVIWELLLLEKRLLRAQAWYGRDHSKEIKGRKGRWFFRVYDWNLCKDGARFYLEVPVVLQTCRESRSIALQHGAIIFGHDCDAGTWWNSDRDVLGFDHTWNFDQHPWSLSDLCGLERVKHIAVDERQAQYFGYEALFNGSDPVEMPRELRRPTAVVLTFQQSDESENYILEFFPDFQQLTVIFLTISTGVSQGSVAHWRDIPEVEKSACQVTFRLGSDIDTAVKQLRMYRELHTNKKCWEEFNTLRRFHTITGLVYAVANDDVDIDRIPHMMDAGFGIYHAEEELPI